MKPEPPADLWERLAALESTKPKPVDSFTVAEYAERFGVATSTAARRIDALIKNGTVREGGRSGNCRFYVMVKP